MAWYNDTVISVTGTTFSGNQAGSVGGGMLFDDNRDGDRFAVNVTSSTFSGNTAATGGGGLGFYNGAGVTVTDTTISGNQASVGGGVFAAFVNGPTAINNSTITGNTANAGGGVLFGGYYGLALNQDTIVANSASRVGGVFMADAQNTALGAAHTARVRSSSKKDKAYGAHDRDGAEATGHAKTARVHAAAAQLNALTLSGTILTQNTNGDLGNSGTASSTHSILGVVDPGTVLTDVGGTLMGVDPMLGPLASNGGPTQTMELLVGSPAINAGPDPVAAFAGNEFDQRGAGFPRVTGGTVDIGAFEVQPVQIAPRFTG
jgi:hypothetical protein